MDHSLRETPARIVVVEKGVRGRVTVCCNRWLVRQLDSPPQVTGPFEFLTQLEGAFARASLFNQVCNFMLVPTVIGQIVEINSR
jgi:hypothetical protein